MSVGEKSENYENICLFIFIKEKPFIVLKFKVMENSRLTTFKHNTLEIQ